MYKVQKFVLFLLVRVALCGLQSVLFSSTSNVKCVHMSTILFLPCTGPCMLVTDQIVHI